MATTTPWFHSLGALLALALLAALAGCGPDSLGEPNTPTATLSGPVDNQRGLEASPSSTPVHSASPPAPSPARHLVVPEWIATALHSSDPQVRLQALDRWVQQGRIGSVDPLMLALNDDDERVRTRVMQLIEQD